MTKELQEKLDARAAAWAAVTAHHEADADAYAAYDAAVAAVAAYAADAADAADAAAWAAEAIKN